MKVGPTLLQQLTDRLFKNFENELRTEALLLGERYWEHNSLMAKLRPPRRRGVFQLAGWEANFDAIRHTMMYGSSIRTVKLPELQKIRPASPRLNGTCPSLAVLDEVCSMEDIEKLSTQLMKDLVLKGRTIGKSELFTKAYTGVHDEVFMNFAEPVPGQGALPPAEPNRGPQPRRLHIHRRK